MTFLSKFNSILSGGVGGCIGGLTVYALVSDKKDKDVSNISLKEITDFKSYEKWDNNWDKYVILYKF